MCAAIVALTAMSAAADFKVYPGAHRDQQLERLANSDPRNQGAESEVYLTPDPFEKVYQFYKTIGTQDERMKDTRGPQLPSGGTIQWAFFTFDGAKSVLPIVFIQNSLTKVPIPIPIPNLNPLQPPLGVIPAPITNITMLKETAKLSPMAAIGIGLAVASRSADAVTGHGSLDVVRYGRLLKARQLVGVRGAGTAFDGLYYVKSVTTTLKQGELKQSFDLTRNGLVSITPKVPV